MSRQSREPARSGPNKRGQTTSAAAAFLFDTEDGTIVGWSPGIDPTGKFAGPGGASAEAVLAVDNSGNNFTNPNPTEQTGAVYKGLAIATSTTPVIPSDPASTALLYASNFRAGTVEVYDANFSKVTSLPAGAFTDPQLPDGYAQQLSADESSGAPASTIRSDAQTLNADTHNLVLAEQQFAADAPSA